MINVRDDGDISEFLGHDFCTAALLRSEEDHSSPVMEFPAGFTHKRGFTIDCCLTGDWLVIQLRKREF